MELHRRSNVEDGQYLKLGKDLESAQKQLQDNPGSEAANALKALLKRADGVTPKHLDSQVSSLESRRKADNASQIAALIVERDICLSELPEEARREALSIACLLERARQEKATDFMECAIARWQSELRKIAPAYLDKQDQIDRLSSSEEINLLKGFKDLPFKGRLSLALNGQDARESAAKFSELSEQFSDWELNRQFSRMSFEQGKEFDGKLQQARIALFQRYWELWTPEVQQKAQQINLALHSHVASLPEEKRADARQLIQNLCDPKEANDMVVSRFLLKNISAPMAETAQQLSDLRAPLREVEKQDKALDRLKKHFGMFGPAIPPADIG